MIVAAAIRMPDGTVHSLPAPKRHHHIIHMLADAGDHSIPIVGVQGFLDDGGRFLDRVKALEHAKAEFQEFNGVPGRQLYSEDLW